MYICSINRQICVTCLPEQALATVVQWTSGFCPKILEDKNGVFIESYQKNSSRGNLIRMQRQRGNPYNPARRESFGSIP